MAEQGRIIEDTAEGRIIESTAEESEASPPEGELD